MAKTSLISLIGKRSGRLLVVSRAENGCNGQARWNCVCDCGNTVTVYGAPLRAGMEPDKYSHKVNSTRSCGCLQKEIAHKVLLYANTTHGQSGTTRYIMFISAKTRAVRDGIPFNLNFADFPEIPEMCPVLGIKLVINHRGGPCANSPTLDKIIPKLGYVVGNIKIISHRANTIKSDASAEEILAVARYVSENTADHVCVVH